jgi:hypothetical protein
MAPAALPVSPPAATAQAADRLGPFLQAFLRSWGSGTGVSQVEFYAERARYDGKERSRAAIAQEAAAYNARWPKRSFWLLDPPTVETLDGPVHRVRLRAGFAVENDARRVTGEATYQIDLVPRGAAFEVVGLEEQITKRESHPSGGH